MAERKLTARQKKFIAEYVQCLNASEAARRAGYSEKTAYSIGSENLRKPEIYNEVQRLFKEHAMSPEEIVGRLAAQARGDVGDFLDPDTMTIDWKRAKEAGKTHLIKKLKQTTTTYTDKNGDGQDTHIFEFALHDSQSALVHLGKTLAMFVNRQEVTGKDGGPLVVFKSGMDINDL